MDEAIRTKLKTLLSQPDRDELLDDPRRLSELVRERLGIDRRREAGFLNAALQEGVPKRLLAMSGSRLSGTMLDNYATKLSDDIGLRQDIARSAIAAWASGLGLDVEDAATATGTTSAHGRGRKLDLGPPPLPDPPPVTTGGGAADRVVRIAGIALLWHGAIELVETTARVWMYTRNFPFGNVAAIYLTGVALGVASIVIGRGGALSARWARFPGAILGAVGFCWYLYLLLRLRLFFVLTSLMGVWYTFHWLMVLAGVVITGASCVCFAFWRRPHRRTQP
jgi:hypothetical protein